MNERLLKLYHRLPPSVRALPVALRGYQLQRSRYGAETERLVAEAIERESWSAERWKTWQEERLGQILIRAATQVPWYREQWNERRRRGDQVSFESLDNWPILEKETLRRNPRAFVAEDCHIRKMVHDHTSGTSGKSLDLWFRRETMRAWYALFEARWRRWYGISLHDRWGILGGQLITPVQQTQPPFWVWNPAMNQLYLSSYHLAPASIGAYLEAIRRYGLVYLLGYTSSLYALAHATLRQKIRGVRLKVVLTNAEPVFDYQRDTIEEAFGCPLRETYGMSEIVAAASECEHRKMHLWPEAGWMECLTSNGPARFGEAGDLVSTGLQNADMPLIRYRIGDRAALADSAASCKCGRALPQLQSVEGRIDDVLYSKDGRRIGRLDPVFKSQLPIQEAQIIQERLDLLRVRYVPDGDFTAKDGQSITERLQARMGDIEVVLEAVGEIPRGPSGKFRAVLCKLPPEQIAELNRGQ